MRLSPIVMRLLLATALATTGVTLVAAVLLGTVRSLQHANEREIRSRDVTVAALQMQTLALDLESGLRGYVISGNRRFLSPWNAARARLPRATAHLQTVVAGDGAQERRVGTLVERLRAYETDFGLPLLGIAVISPDAARASVVTAESRRRIEAVRAVLRQVLGAEAHRSAQRASESRSLTHRSLVLVLAALAGSFFFIVLFAVYVARTVATPVGQVAAAARRVAGGDFSVRAPERGVGEVRELMLAFNAMTRTLEQGRGELLDQNALLQSSEQHKSDLISMVSHELRTPLSSVLGFTRLLLERDFSEPERERYLRIVDSEARRLAALADDFLEVQHVEEGRFELTLAPHDLTEVVRGQTELFFGPDVAHTCALRVPAHPVLVVFDSDRLVQVIGNLLSNAIKFSPSGGAVEVTLEEDADLARVTVSDHGVGIRPEDQEQIFTKFFRGSAPAAGIHGTGLGLAVSRDLILAHGGELHFASEDSVGTTFWFEIPRQESARVGAQQEAVSAPRSAH